MANKYIKRCQTSLIIREMQIKATVRYYHTPVYMANTQKSKHNSVAENVGKKRTLI